jgi:hypothetical protein
MYPSNDTEARLRLLIRESVRLRERLAVEVERSRFLCACYLEAGRQRERERR